MRGERTEEGRKGWRERYKDEGRKLDDFLRKKGASEEEIQEAQAQTQTDSTTLSVLALEQSEQLQGAKIKNLEKRIEQLENYFPAGVKEFNNVSN